MVRGVLEASEKFEAMESVHQEVMGQRVGESEPPLEEGAVPM